MLLGRSSTVRAVLAAACLAVASGCAIFHPMPVLDDQKSGEKSAESGDFNYIIGPGDQLSVFVWRNPELSSNVIVRPDGKFSSPLVEDLQASGRTPSALARDIEKKLNEYVRDPLVTVTVTGFMGEPAEQIRVVGEAAKPQAIPFRRNLTVLDVLIQAGGLTPFAAGNRASIVRTSDKGKEQYRVHLDDLLKGGDIDSNVLMQPGDILIIPEAWF